MTSHKLPTTYTGRRGISLPTDNTSHWSYQKRAEARKPAPEKTSIIELVDVVEESDAVTLPRGAPAREPTVEISVLDYIEERSVEPAKPAEARESSAMIDLKHLVALAQGKAPLEKPASEPPAESPAPGAPQRESSVMVSLQELRFIEDHRVAEEMAGECIKRLTAVGGKLASLGEAYEKTRNAYAAEGFVADPVLDETDMALTLEFKGLGERYSMLRGAVGLRPGQEGYLDAEAVKAESDGISAGADALEKRIEGAHLLNRTVNVTLQKLKIAAMEAAARGQAEAAAPGEESLDRAVDDLIGDIPSGTPREPSVEVEIDLDDKPAEAAPAAPQKRSWRARALSAVARTFGIASDPAPAEDVKPAEEEKAAGSGKPETTQEVSLSDIEAEDITPSGIPWQDEHAQVRLSDDEMTFCEGLLEQRKLYWILPVPPQDSMEKADAVVLSKFRNEARVRLRGKSYYVFDGDGFAGAKRAARVGNQLHIWPEAKTDYDFLGSMSIEFKDPRKEADWPEKFSHYQMTLEESAACNYFFPDNRPRWLHPVPDEGTLNESDRAILETMRGTQQISLGGRKYYVLNVDSVAEWREMVLYLPKTRIASRGGGWLSVWDRNDNGYYLFFNSNTLGTAYHGPMLASLKEKKGVRPYDSEKEEIEHLFSSMKDVYLYELGSLRDMSASELSWVVKSSNSLIEKKGVSPLLSIGGRWYAALDVFIPDTVKAVYNGENVVAVNQGADLKDRLAEMKRKLAQKRGGEGVKFSVPPQPTLKEDVISALPEGEVRFLYYVGPENEGVVLQRPTVSMTIEGEKSTYIITDRQINGAMPVVRRGEKIFMTSAPDEERQPGEVSLELEIDQ